MSDDQGGRAAKYVNFRVSPEDFVEIKIAALRAGKTLGAYLLDLHKAAVTHTTTAGAVISEGSSDD
jgi:hypothetical protein